MSKPYTPNLRTKAGRDEAARIAQERRRTGPNVPCIWDQFVLDNDSQSGLAWNMPGSAPRAGCPCEVTDWPYDNPMRGQIVFPPSWEVSVVVGYERRDGGHVWQAVYETVEAGTVRTVLQEYNEEIRLIAALEKHLSK